jgi:hypothetical protein
VRWGGAIRPELAPVARSGTELEMNYLEPSDYEAYGLEASTPVSWIAAASTLIDSYCRRSTLGVTTFTERIRLTPGRNCVRVTYLPLATDGPAVPPLLSARGRYAPPRRGEDATLWDLGNDVAFTFALPGTWVDIDVSTMDFFDDTGEISWLPNPLGLMFQELELTYTAGFATIPDAIKFACAQIVRNAQATPALNVHTSTLSTMHLEYFADTLLDQTVKLWLAPYLAQKAA